MSVEEALARSTVRASSISEPKLQCFAYRHDSGSSSLSLLPPVDKPNRGYLFFSVLLKLLGPSFQCGVSRCSRRWSPAKSFAMLIENFRPISVSPHLEPFEQSPMNALCRSFGDPEASFIKLIYGSLEGFIDSIEDHAGASV